MGKRNRDVRLFSSLKNMSVVCSQNISHIISLSSLTQSHQYIVYICIHSTSISNTLVRLKTTHGTKKMRSYVSAGLKIKAIEHRKLPFGTKSSDLIIKGGLKTEGCKIEGLRYMYHILLWTISLPACGYIYWIYIMCTYQITGKCKASNPELA